jgi:hypothetical protein
MAAESKNEYEGTQLLVKAAKRSLNAWTYYHTDHELQVCDNQDTSTWWSPNALPDTDSTDSELGEWTADFTRARMESVWMLDKALCDDPLLNRWRVYAREFETTESWLELRMWYRCPQMPRRQFWIERRFREAETHGITRSWVLDESADCGAKVVCDSEREYAHGSRVIVLRVANVVTRTNWIALLLHKRAQTVVQESLDVLDSKMDAKDWVDREAVASSDLCWTASGYEQGAQPHGVLHFMTTSTVSNGDPLFVAPYWHGYLHGQVRRSDDIWNRLRAVHRTVIRIVSPSCARRPFSLSHRQSKRFPGWYFLDDVCLGGEKEFIARCDAFRVSLALMFEAPTKSTAFVSRDGACLGRAVGTVIAAYCM